MCSVLRTVHVQSFYCKHLHKGSVISKIIIKGEILKKQTTNRPLHLTHLVKMADIPVSHNLGKSVLNLAEK